MDMINCNIIKDLLPSYIDEICSEDSRKLVQEHIQKCSACQNLLETMTATELVSEETSSRQIDYMKKVRQTYTKKNIISFALVIICMAAGVIIGINSYRFAFADLYYCYIIMPIVMAETYLMVPGGGMMKKHEKWEMLMGGAGILLILYCIALRFAAVYCVKGLEEGVGLFGISSDKMGVIFHWQLLAVILLQVIMLLTVIMISLKTGFFHGVLIDIHGTGVCLAFVFYLILGRLTTLEQFREMWNKSFLVVLAEGLLMAVTVICLKRKKCVGKNFL